MVVEYKDGFLISFGKGAFRTGVEKDIEAGAALHVVEDSCAHCVIVIEEETRRLFVQVSVDLHHTALCCVKQSWPEGERALKESVVIIAAQRKVARSFFSRVVKPVKRTSIEGGPRFNTVYMR